MTNRHRLRETWVYFETAEDCAESASAVFEMMGWVWAGRGTPTRQMILDQLRRFECELGDGPFFESGRLVVCGPQNELLGKFGHQRPSPEWIFLEGE